MSRSGATQKARERQKITNEKYQSALMHIRGECGRCLHGDRCGPCSYEPCWSCRPICSTGKRCVFDDLRPDGSKACATCGKSLPPAPRHPYGSTPGKIQPGKPLVRDCEGGDDCAVGCANE